MTNDNKLSPVTVYVTARPSLENGGTPAKAHGFSYISGLPLEQQEKYVFTKWELERLLRYAMDKMENRVDYENNKDGWETVPPSKDEIIQSLFSK